MTPELQHTLVAVALGLGLIVGFLSVVGFIVLGAWGLAWLRARWEGWRDRAAGESDPVSPRAPARPPRPGPDSR